MAQSMVSHLLHALLLLVCVSGPSFAVAQDAAPAKTWPEYVRGKDMYKWVLTEAERENGITYLGAADRLRVVVDKMKSGKDVKVSTIGGSITAGQGCVDAPNWPQYLFNWLQDQFGSKVTGLNGAVGGTLSSYMSVCHNIHVPRDADLVFVEYSVNDSPYIAPLYQNQLRRSFERLLRKLLNYPNKPAVVLVHEFQWNHPHHPPGTFWNNAEREFTEFALYYHLPSLSIKGCCYQKLVHNESPGFSVKTNRIKDFNGLKDIAFYYDDIHPDGRTGSRVSAELAMHLIMKAAKDVDLRPVTDAERAAATTKLPAPVVPENYESLSDKCFIGQQFTSIVVAKDGWDWINESKTDRPKWGFVSTKPGSVLKIKVDTKAAGENTQAEVLVELAYLRSYEHMGKAGVTCDLGCVCKPTMIDGHIKERNSQLHLLDFYATQHTECIIAIKVLEESSSGEHKVKVAGIMVSEEVGQHEGIRNHAAVEYVHDISSRSKGNSSLFDVTNHARRALQWL